MHGEPLRIIVLLLGNVQEVNVVLPKCRHAKLDRNQDFQEKSQPAIARLSRSVLLEPFCLEVNCVPALGRQADEQNNEIENGIHPDRSRTPCCCACIQLRHSVITKSTPGGHGPTAPPKNPLNMLEQHTPTNIWKYSWKWHGMSQLDDHFPLQTGENSLP